MAQKDDMGLQQKNNDKISSLIGKFMQYVLFALLLIMVVTVFANVLGRYLFSTSLNWADEVSRAAFVWLSFIGIAVTMWNNGHIGMGNVIARINPRAGYFADLIASLLVLIFSIYVLVGGVKLVALTIVQLTEYLSIPAGYIYAIAPCGAVLMIVISLRDLIRTFTSKGEN